MFWFIIIAIVWILSLILGCAISILIDKLLDPSFYWRNNVQIKILSIHTNRDSDSDSISLFIALIIIAPYFLLFVIVELWQNRKDFISKKQWLLERFEKEAE